MPGPFRFVALPSSPRDLTSLLAFARQAESLGYDALLMADHVDQLAPLPALAAVAQVTERLRLGTFVLNNDLRYPAVLAQELATLDVLCQGRLQIGLGAGYSLTDYRHAGVDMRPPGVRVERLAQTVRVLKALFTGQLVELPGQCYRNGPLEDRIEPVQKPHPPLLVGGGSRRVLALAATEAEIVGLSVRSVRGELDYANALPEPTDEKLGWIRTAAGSGFDKLEINTFGPVTVTDRPVVAAEFLAARLQECHGVQVDHRELLDSPHFFFGTARDLVAKCRELRDRWGINSIGVWGDLAAFSPVVEELAGT